LAFTFYVDVYGLSNLIGHYLKIISFYLIYEAIFETGLTRPYALLFRNLKQNEEALRRAHDELEKKVEERTVELRKEIKERKQAEESLGEAELSYRTVADFTYDWEYWTNPDGTLRYVSPSCERISGYGVHQFMDNPSLLREIISPEDSKLWDQHNHDSGQERKPREIQFRIRTRDGEIRWIEHVCQPVIGKQGEFLGFRASNRNITERKEAEKELRIKDSAIASSINAIGITDLDGKLIYVNDSLVKMWGYDSADEILGRSLPEFWEGEGVLKTIAVLREKGARIGEDIGKRKDGSSFNVNFSTSMIRDEAGNPLYMFGSFSDITEQKISEKALREREAELRRSQKDLRFLAGRLLSAQEEERRRLARELHDDLTQRLAVMAIETGKLEMQFDSAPGPFRDKLVELKEQMMQLSGDVHAISRQLHPSILHDLGLVDAVKSECDNFTRREGIVVTFRPKGVPSLIPQDVSLCIFRIIQESLRNIAKYAQASEAHVSLVGKDGSIHLSIKDTGIGFDPKKVKKKTGLGLASMEERVRLIQGDFSLTSRPGKGTVIRIRVPLSGA
jgi:PAS domain S-box-containing protein